ncbi:hypothetical protein ABIC75_004638, partial [Dyella japonica]
TRLELATGVTATLGAHVSLYGQLGYQWAVNAAAGGDHTGGLANVGLTYAW